ncbi:unnamed protein product [Linum tenue]|uniref:Secreted protein n=1 Tax=Linum tenue TaxID=586396 RepID=A0AAV0K3W4_9ROSI|nr:unnamed protein product [Linum tenue]
MRLLNARLGDNFFICWFVVKLKGCCNSDETAPCTSFRTKAATLSAYFPLGERFRCFHLQFS